MHHSQERRIMRLFLVAAFLAMASASAVKDVKTEKEKSVAASPATKQPMKFYHESVGIPKAKRLEKAEKEASDIQHLIVGGEPSPVNAYPHLVGLIISLTTGATSICGSSMLTTTRALTAAHCWWDGQKQASKFKLVFGSHRLFSGGVRVDTEDVETHADWDPYTTYNDIALIIFEAVGLTDAIKPVALPSGALLEQDFAGYSAQAAGYGVTSDGGSITKDQFQSHVTLEVITNDLCRETFGSDIIESSICTSGEGGKSTCGGDSGGPLTITHEEETVLIGVTSFVYIDGCEAGDPAAFTRVSFYDTWIQDRL